MARGTARTAVAPVPVKQCTVEDCSYNCASTCHATGVAVGDVHASCDTFTVSAASICEGQGFVTDCFVESCAHNASGGCHARAIEMRRHSAHADCATYQARA